MKRKISSKLETQKNCDYFNFLKLLLGQPVGKLKFLFSTILLACIVPV